ncbi:MAG TPA: hypothetical protein VFJ43_03460 [Bacteroidia bacterium]|nr:hypothetical protein [Bacteroidia bacterium]
MKNKKTAYFMVPIVLAIWGVIGWKVYAAVKGNDKNILVSSEQKKEKSSLKEIPDTVSLIASYRDPFLGKVVVIKDNSNQKSRDSKLPVVKVPDPPAIPEPWPKISYHGLIRRSGSARTVGFLSVNGASYFVQGGEDLTVVKVGLLWKDSVEVLFGKEKKIFRK